MESGVGSSRRRQSLPEDKTESPNLRDFLRVKEDENSHTTLAGLTLGAVLSADKRLLPVQSSRTLLDIIRDDSIGGGKDSKKSWKSFKDKLRLRRAGAAWTSTVHIPASDMPIQQNSNRMITRRNSTRIPPTTVSNSDDPTPESTQPELSTNGVDTRTELNSLPSNRAMMLRRGSSLIPERQSSRLIVTENNAAESSEQHQELPSTAVTDAEEGMGETAEEEPAEEGGGEQPARMSLMSLLAETDRQMGLDGSSYMMDDEDEEEEEEQVQEGGGGESGGDAGYNNCCVCMVRHKGAAFIPCGHTFCRLCSRELWVQRGNCPLCNNFILEILDIF